MSTHTMQADDLFELEFLNGGKLSPDGSQVIYMVNHVDTEDDKELSTLYLLNLASDETRQITNGKAKDGNPQWSPDGKSIAFSSDRNDKPQLFLLPVDGGEAQQITELKQGVAGFAWSPDGSKIAFSAGPDYEGDSPRDLTKEVYRVTRTIYRFDAMGYLDDVVNNLYVLNVESGEVTQLTDDETHNVNPRWSPDGSKILYDATMTTDSSRALYPSIRIIDLEGKSEAILGDWGETMNANFTPDGKKIVFIGQPDRGQAIGSKSDLHVIDLETGMVENRSDGLLVGVGGTLSMDMPIIGLRAGNVFVSADSLTAYAPVQSGGNVHIYAISLSGDEQCVPVVEVDGATSLLDMGDDKILYTLTKFNQPPDLWLGKLSVSESKQLTSLNLEYLGGIELPTTQRLTWESVDGVEVEGWFMKPAIGEAPYPTILYIHGGPHGAYGNAFHFDFQMLAGAGYGVLFLNHRASTGYGDSFSTAIKGDWGNLDYNDLMTGVDHAIELGLADPDRLGVCGTSGGGNLSCWIIGNTTRFKAAIPQNPVTNWRSFYGTSDIGIWFGVEQLGGHPHEIPAIYEKCSPITYAHNCTTPTLMVQCEHDWRCPAEQSEQFYTVLKANGCITEMLRQPGGSHGGSINGAINLRRGHNDAMLDWFGRYV